jgi:hypothetical protein
MIVLSSFFPREHPMRTSSVFAMLAAAVCGCVGAERGVLAGPLGSDPNATFRKSGVYPVGSAGQDSITVDAAAYAPGTVIGGSVPTSPTLWTYAYQVFDNGAVFDRLRLDTAIGGFAEQMGLAPDLGQAGGVGPTQLHLLFPFGLPAADYFNTPISGTMFTTTVYFTSSNPPYPGFLILRNGSDTFADTVAQIAGAVYTPVPGPAAFTGFAMGIAFTARRRRS